MNIERITGAIAAMAVAFSAFAGLGITAEAATGTISGEYANGIVTWTTATTDDSAALSAGTYSPTYANSGDGDYVELEFHSISGDAISSSGLYMANPTFGGSGTTTPQNRYIKIAPEYDGLFSFDVTVSRNQSNSDYTGRVYVQDITDADHSSFATGSSVLLYEASVGKNAESATKNGITIPMSKGHTYGIYVYEHYSSRVNTLFSNMSYDMTKTLGGSYTNGVFTWTSGNIGNLSANLLYSTTADDAYADLSVFGTANDSIVNNTITLHRVTWNTANTYNTAPASVRGLHISAVKTGTLSFDANIYQIDGTSGNYTDTVYLVDVTDGANVDSSDKSKWKTLTSGKPSNNNPVSKTNITADLISGHKYVIFNSDWSNRTGVTFSNIKYTPTAYNISTDATNCTISIEVDGVSANTATEGDIVTVTVTADTTYALSDAPAVAPTAGGDAITVNEAGEGVYTFTMPAEAVTVTAATSIRSPGYILTDTSESSIWKITGTNITDASGASIHASTTSTTADTIAIQPVSYADKAIGFTFTPTSADTDEQGLLDIIGGDSTTSILKIDRYGSRGWRIRGESDRAGISLGKNNDIAILPGSGNYIDVYVNGKYVGYSSLQNNDTSRTITGIKIKANTEETAYGVNLDNFRIMDRPSTYTVTGEGAGTYLENATFTLGTSSTGYWSDGTNRYATGATYTVTGGVNIVPYDISCESDNLTVAGTVEPGQTITISPKSISEGVSYKVSGTPQLYNTSTGTALSEDELTAIGFTSGNGTYTFTMPAYPVTVDAITYTTPEEITNYYNTGGSPYHYDTATNHVAGSNDYARGFTFEVNTGGLAMRSVTVGAAGAATADTTTGASEITGSGESDVTTATNVTNDNTGSTKTSTMTIPGSFTGTVIFGIMIHAGTKTTAATAEQINKIQSFVPATGFTINIE